MASTTQRGRPHKRPPVIVTLPPDRAGFTSVEVAHLLGISRSQIYVLLHQGEFVTFHIGNRLRITADSVADFVNRQIAAEAS